MWQNIIVALSNFTIFYPIYLSYLHDDYLSCGVISFVGIFSFLSHLAENHKHGMPGIGFSKTTSYLLNRMDVLGASLTAVRCLYLYYINYGFQPIIFSHPWLCVALVVSFCFGQISEYKKYNPKLRTRYIITHCLWHICIFSTTGKFLEDLIY